MARAAPPPAPKASTNATATTNQPADVPLLLRPGFMDRACTVTHPHRPEKGCARIAPVISETRRPPFWCSLRLRARGGQTQEVLDALLHEDPADGGQPIHFGRPAARRLGGVGLQHREGGGAEG